VDLPAQDPEQSLAGRGIYLDWNATTPPCPEVLEAMREASSAAWANPASVHAFGRQARAWVERAREAVAALTGFDARDVVLTSGGTEANNLALLLAEGPLARAPAPAPSRGRPRREDQVRSAPSAAATSVGIVVSRIEHPSILRMAEALAGRGVRVTWVDPTPEGFISPEALEDAIDRAALEAEIRLVVLQAVNHETGVIQPIAEAAALAHARGALLHVDAIQAAGRLSPEVWAGADLVSIAAHKMRGPKGIGALATKPGIRLRALLVGGQQEKGLRPGTQDASLSAGFAVAAERAPSGPARYAAVEALRDRLEADLLRAGEELLRISPLRNGTARRAPHVTNLSWPGWRGDELCAALDLEGVAVSSGSACSAGTAEPSPVLRAMVGEARASSAVRVSLGEETSQAEIDEAVRRWRRVLSRSASTLAT
jgi:cysteine desulfurase